MNAYEKRIRERALEIASRRWNNDQIDKAHPLMFDGLSATTQGFLSAKEIDVAKLSIAREAEAWKKGHKQGWSNHDTKASIIAADINEHLSKLGLVP